MIEPTLHEVVLISGKAAAGKDTVAGWIAECAATSHIPVIIPFAEKLKDSYCDLFGVDRADMRKYEVKAQHRPRLIQYGQAMRAIAPDVWVDAVEREMRERRDHAPDRTGVVTIVPDLRFVSELARMVERCGTEVHVIRVHAGESSRAARMGPERWFDYSRGPRTDPSETQMDFTDTAASHDLCLTQIFIRGGVANIYNGSRSTPGDLRASVQRWWRQRWTAATPDAHSGMGSAARAMADELGPEMVLAPARSLDIFSCSAHTA